MERTQAERLIEKYLDGTADAAERHAVESSINKHLDGSTPLRTSRELLAAEQANRTAVLAAIGGAKARNQRAFGRLAKRALPYAAAFAALLTVGWLLFGNDDKSPAVSQASEEILPGGNRATLTLADGRVIDLDENQAGIVVNEGITYLDGSQVMADKTVATKPEAPLFHSITTPRGGTYRITLPDGSQVWLNAASTLKYPSRFAGDSREIFLEGEGFFAISSQQSEAGRVPFRVVTSGQTVEVLGTAFNISAYPDDIDAKTTLVEGSVRLARTNDLQSAITMKPGQQAVTSEGNTIVREVDPDVYIAWKTGHFVFAGATIQTVMTQLARWYDIEVAYESIPFGGVFYADISRDRQISEILSILEKTNGVRFKITGRRVMVSQ